MDSIHGTGRLRAAKSSPPLSDGPPQLSPIDKIIASCHGSSTAIEATPQHLQASKQCPMPSLRERIEQLQRQNSRLAHEIAYYREMEQHRKEFEHDMTRLKESFEASLFKLGRIQRQVDYEWGQLRQEGNNDSHNATQAT